MVIVRMNGRELGPPGAEAEACPGIKGYLDQKYASVCMYSFRNIVLRQRIIAGDPTRGTPLLSLRMVMAPRPFSEPRGGVMIFAQSLPGRVS